VATPPVSSALACPACRGDLHAVDGEEALECVSCARRYPIVRGIPRLVDESQVVELQSRTADAFGWQWQHFSEMHEEYEAQFLDWIHPFGPSFFAGKRVLDAGCGIGRHAYFAARFGASEVVAADLSDAVETARETLRALPNVQVVQADLLRPPFPEDEPALMFDLVYSIGVLHHLPDPRAGILSLARLVKPGGTLFVWVYGYEGNALVRNVVEPLRRLTTRMRPSRLRVIAWPLSAALFGAVHVVYRPLRHTPLGRLLPTAEYVTSLKVFTFRQVYSIVFDQLVAPSSYYVRREELQEWLAAGGLVDVTVTPRNENSWRGWGRVPVDDP
jgi:SAM-dependent methyltransferase